MRDSQEVDQLDFDVDGRDTLILGNLSPKII